MIVERHTQQYDCIVKIEPLITQNTAAMRVTIAAHFLLGIL